MPAVFTMQNETEQYTMSFNNALDDRTCKYIKPCMQLIKVKKTRKARPSVDIIKQAESIVINTRKPRKLVAVQTMIINTWRGNATIAARQAVRVNEGEDHGFKQIN